MREWVDVWVLEGFSWPEEVSKKLTGRWKLLDGKVYLEIKSWLFKTWISEDYLLIEYHSEIIFDCNS